MWTAVGCSVAGTSHAETRLPCQDFCDYWQCELGSNRALLIAIADGAGSAALAEVGSREAVSRLLREVAASGRCVSEITREEVGVWLRTTLEHLTQIAEREKAQRSDLACTILLAVLGEEHAVFAQIGDGAWVVKQNGAIEAATWPFNGEYANQTKFLTSPDAFDFLQFKKYACAIESVGGLTDGLQPLSLKFSDKTPHSPFFEAMFEGLKNCEDPTSLRAPLMAFLESDRVNERTDDDKTLVIAHRCVEPGSGDVLG